MFIKKVVLITGASLGIGAETALQFSKLDAKLVITGRNKENLEGVAKQCRELSPSQLEPLAVIADVVKETDIENLVMKAVDIIYKQLDILVNNAGIVACGSIENTSLEQYDTIMSTNCDHYCDASFNQNKGKIINVSSLAGLRSFPGLLTYSLSKAALDQFTRCVSLELAPKGVCVNAVNPGTIITDIHLRMGMSKADYKEHLEHSKEVHALGKVGTPDEVVSGIIFLVSDGASNLTGVTLPIDGGRQAMCP